MIPKIIHYCWFGGKPKPQKVLECIETWKKYLPDFKIMEWNESNFDYRKIKYTREAYAVKKYAFVSDVARLYALYEFGGVYFDTDICAVKKIDQALLQNESFLGYEFNNQVGTGVMATVLHAQWVKDFLNFYTKQSFITLGGNLKLKPNTEILVSILCNYGCKFDGKNDIIGTNIHLYPYDILCAKNYQTGKIEKTTNTFVIHDYQGTWAKVEKANGFLFRLKNLFIKFLLC